MVRTILGNRILLTWRLKVVCSPAILGLLLLVGNGDKRSLLLMCSMLSWVVVVIVLILVAISVSKGPKKAVVPSGNDRWVQRPPDLVR